MKYRFLSVLLASVLTLPFGLAVPAAAQEQTFVSAPRAGVIVDIPYACPAVQRSIMAMQEDYPSGMKWTNDDFYMWNGGGTYAGGYGCVAFAYILSDAAFGDLPCTEYYTFDASRIRVGDILRNSYHSVIVLEVKADHVVVAEGNINSSILWGRTISFDEIGDSGFEHHITRYPEGIAFQKTSAVLSEGELVQIDVISKDAPVLTWTSSNPGIAGVDGSGIVSAVGPGTAVITATTGAYSASFTVTVEGDAPVLPTISPGDVNADAQVDAVDAAMILVEAAKQGAGIATSFTDVQAGIADVNSSGGFNSIDAACILQYAAAAGSGYTGSFVQFLAEIL